jgi:hypothetical protein
MYLVGVWVGVRVRANPGPSPSPSPKPRPKPKPKPNPHTRYQTPREKSMITGFIENSWPKSQGSRMLPTAAWTRQGTTSAMAHLEG